MSTLNANAGNRGTGSYNKSEPELDMSMLKMASYAKSTRVTSSQLRKVLSAVINITNKAKFENPDKDRNKEISDVIKREKEKLIVRVVYQSARDKNVNKLFDEIKLTNEISKIKTYGDLEIFHNMIEELVACAKYYNEKK